VNCREALEQFQDHVDGRLSPLQRWQLRLHLWICGQCRKYLRSYRIAVDAEKAAYRDSSATVPTEIPDALVASILSAVKMPPRAPSNDTSRSRES
jgi:hypothetical protein